MDFTPYEVYFAECETALTPLFRQDSIDFFDFVLSLLRVNGQESEGWDTLSESYGMMCDLSALTRLRLPDGEFPEPDRTAIRIQLLGYAHLVEMDAPYEILANLCNVKLGLPVHLQPFLNDKGKTIGVPDKIARLKSLSKQAGVSSVELKFDEFYSPRLRNAIGHSDFVISGEEFRMRNQSIVTPDGSHAKSLPLTEVLLKVSQAFAYYDAFFHLERMARRSLGSLAGRAFPYQSQYKGLIEYLSDNEGLLVGAVLHWPNGQESSYRRNADGSRPMNLMPCGNSIEYRVDLVADPGFFSPLVSKNEEPRYTPLSGCSQPLSWPQV